MQQEKEITVIKLDKQHENIQNKAIYQKLYLSNWQKLEKENILICC